MKNIIQLIRLANPERSKNTYSRRLIKLSEEIGEHAEAYLNVTSAGNGKGKTWDDVREEAADILIVAVDVALTPIKDDEDADAMEANLLRRVDALNYAVSRVYENYEVMTLRMSWDFGSLTKVHLTGDLSWDRAPIGYVVASAINLAMTPLPDQIDYSEKDIIENLTRMVEMKLEKWRSNRVTGMNASDG